MRLMMRALGIAKSTAGGPAPCRALGNDEVIIQQCSSEGLLACKSDLAETSSAGGCRTRVTRATMRSRYLGPQGWRLGKGKGGSIRG